jgi:hypothetical protein
MELVGVTDDHTNNSLSYTVESFREYVMVQSADNLTTLMCRM